MAVADREEGYEDFDRIRRGDVIDFNGRPRTVRKVSRHPESDQVQFVTFAILRESWTGRPETTYHRGDLKQKYGGIIARRKDADDLCATDLECDVQEAIDCDGDCNPHGNFCLLESHVTADQSAGAVW